MLFEPHAEANCYLLIASCCFPAVGGRPEQYKSTASCSCFLEMYSRSVCATWIDPGPSSTGVPQLLSAGMSVVNFATMLSMPSTVRSFMNGISRTNSASARFPTCLHDLLSQSFNGSHQPVEQLCARMIGDHVGSPSAFNECRYSACMGRFRVHRQLHRTQTLQGSRAACQWPIRQAQDKPSAPSFLSP